MVAPYRAVNMAFSPDAYRFICGRNLAEKPAMGLCYSWPGLGLLKTRGLLFQCALAFPCFLFHLSAGLHYRR
jgi:hypothetical protein